MWNCKELKSIGKNKDCLGRMVEAKNIPQLFFFLLKSTDDDYLNLNLMRKKTKRKAEAIVEENAHMKVAGQDFNNHFKIIKKLIWVE